MAWTGASGMMRPTKRKSPWPIFGFFNETFSYRILIHVRPLLLCTGVTSKTVIKKAILPMNACSFCGPTFPGLDQCFETMAIARRQDRMQVIGHKNDKF